MSLVLPRSAQWLWLLIAVLTVFAVRAMPMWWQEAGDSPIHFFQAQNGEYYPYLDGWDSYGWLRQARNYLQTGSPCDAIEDGECRDNYTYAPVGAEMRYADSFHIKGLAWMHRITRFFDADYPLIASGFWLQMIIGALGVLPAFWIARRLGLGSAPGGFAAALMIGLNYYFLIRSMRADNDVWNVVVPLWALWALFSALQARTPARSAAWALAAALIAAFHSAIWSGWIFTYGIALGGLLMVLVAHALRTLWLQRKLLAVVQSGGVGQIFLATLVFALGCEIAVPLLAGVDGILFDKAARLMAFSIGGSVALAQQVEVDSVQRFFPSNFAFVRELSQGGLGQISSLVGGNALFFVGWFAFLLSVLSLRLRLFSATVFVAAVAIIVVLVFFPNWHRNGLIALLGIPVVIALLARLGEQDEAEFKRITCIGVLAFWFFAAFFLAFSGRRFNILFIVPFGLVAGAALGRVHSGLLRWFTHWLQNRQTHSAAGPGGSGEFFLQRSKPLRAVLHGLVFITVIALLAVPVSRAIEFAANYKPRFNDSWWQTLTLIREQSPPETIVNTWWDYGYFVKYFAERRVSADGASLLSRVPYWMSKMLLARSDQEALGWLRMLNCGSDASPQPEGEMGAYQRLRNAGLDPINAHEVLEQLVVLDRAEAGALLRSRNIDETRQVAILQATHCIPPPSVLILSNEMSRITTWQRMGNWDMRQKDYIGDQRPYFMLGFRACKRGDDGLFACVLARRTDKTTKIEQFVYSAEKPEAGYFVVSKAGKRRHVFPRAVLVAGKQRLQENKRPDGYAVTVLVDTVNHRILASPYYLLRSAFTQLFYLNGRYMPHFQKISDRIAGRERVAAFSVRWPEGEAD